MPIAGPEPSPVPLQAIVAGAVACAVFGMPILLAFTLGFILKAVGPAIVIQLMFDLQRKGRGVDKGAPSVYAQKLRFAHGAGCSMPCLWVLAVTKFMTSSRLSQVRHGH